jgi:predicted CopG family antitoxin
MSPVELKSELSLSTAVYIYVQFKKDKNINVIINKYGHTKENEIKKGIK